MVVCCCWLDQIDFVETSLLILVNFSPKLNSEVLYSVRVVEVHVRVVENLTQLRLVAGLGFAVGKSFSIRSNCAFIVSRNAAWKANIVASGGTLFTHSSRNSHS